MSKTAEAVATIVNTRGLHARAAARICETSAQFKSRLTLAKDGTTVGAGSLMALLMLGAGKGSKVTIRGEGADADEAVEALRSLIEAGFHEED